MKAATKFFYRSITDYDCYICFRKHLQLEESKDSFMKEAYEGRDPSSTMVKMIPHP
jgi:hypothetical protein